MEAINANARFETTFASANPKVGDVLDFEVVSSNKGGLALKLINNHTLPSQQGANQMSSDDLMTLYKQSQFVPEDTSNDSIAQEEARRREEELEIQRAVNKAKNKVAFTSNNASVAAVNELMAKGIPVNKLDINALNNELSRIQSESLLIKDDHKFNMTVDDNTQLEATKEQSMDADRASWGTYNDEIVKGLQKAKLPLTPANIEGIEKALSMYMSISDFDDGAIIQAIKKGKMTLDNLYLAKHEAGSASAPRTISDTTWKMLQDQVEKLFTDEDIQNTDKNMKHARMLMSNGLPITSESLNNVANLQGIRNTVDLQKLISKAADNIRAGVPTTSVTIDQILYTLGNKNLTGTYKDLTVALPGMNSTHVDTLMEKAAPVTLHNLKAVSGGTNPIIYLPAGSVPSIQEGFYQPVGDLGGTAGLQSLGLGGSLENLYGNTSETAKAQQAILNKRHLAEIQLKFTSEAAYRLASKNINIDTMPMAKALEQIRGVELEFYAKTLGSVAGLGHIHKAEEMQKLYDAIATTKTPLPQVFSGVMTKETAFTVDGIATTQMMAKRLMGYDQFATVPKAKYGDVFNKVYDQLSPLLKEIGMEATEENVRAASILARAKMDVTHENIMQIKVMDQKIEMVQDKLHPQIAADMIKEGLNPLQMHLDEMLEYIEKYDDKYGNGLKEKLANHVLSMDVKNLSKDQRSAMLAVYRILNDVQKHSGLSLGVGAKAGYQPTLGHLLHAANYLARPAGTYNYVDGSLDNLSKDDLVKLFNSTFSVATPNENLKGLLDASFNDSRVADIRLDGNSFVKNDGATVEPSKTAELKEGTFFTSKYKDDAKASKIGLNASSYSAEVTSNEEINILLDKTHQAPTEKNIARLSDMLQGAYGSSPVTPAAVNEVIHNDLVLKETAEKLTPEILSEALESEETINQPLKDILNNAKEYSEDTRLSASLEKAQQIVQDLQDIVANNPKAVQMLEANNAPANLPNIEVMAAMMKQSNFIGEKLNSIADKIEDEEITSAVIDASIEEASTETEVQEAKEVLEQRLEEVFYDDATDQETREDIVKVQTAIKVSDMTSAARESMSIPVSIHGKISTLNMFVPRGVMPTDRAITTVFSIDTIKFGAVDAFAKLEGNNVSFFFRNTDESVLNNLKERTRMLEIILKKEGFNLSTVMFGDETDDDIINERVMGEDIQNALPNQSNETIKGQMYKLAISVAKYLDKIGK